MGMRPCRRDLLAALLGTALSACSQPTPGPPPGGGAVVLARENLSPDFIGFIGRKTQHAPPFLGISETNYYCLRSFVDRRTGETVHQLYFSDSYFGPARDWNAARDGSGRPRLFVPLTRDEIACDPGCSYVEEFAVTLPESAFRANPEDLPITRVKSLALRKQRKEYDRAFGNVPLRQRNECSNANTGEEFVAWQALVHNADLTAANLLGDGGAICFQRLSGNRGEAD